ncbi:unnamed protein product [Lymnaea stagnalis]|uniref:MANSC domain-containing protein n=1 Tax=Lymnaea stagnalis TaxID=6523 RepID=A0AAV2H4J1_LYMST
MQSSNMITMALKQTLLMCLAFETCLSTLMFEIGVYRHFLDTNELPTYISFNKYRLFRFQECLCSNSTKNCIAYLSCLNEKETCYVTYISNTTQEDVFNLHNIFICFLDVYLRKVLCERHLNQSNDNYTALFHINNPSVCQLNCAEIIWRYNQNADILYNPEGTIKYGNASPTCTPLLSTVTSSSTTTQTTRNTTFFPKQSTTTSTAKVTTPFTLIKHRTSVSSTSIKDLSTLELKTDMFNGGNGDSDDKFPIIFGVTISLFVLLAFGVGLFLLRRWQHKHDAHTRRMSQKQCVTDSAELDSNNIMKREISSYCNINSENQGYTNVVKEVYQTVNTNIMDEYTVVTYSNGEFYQTDSVQPGLHSPGPQQSNSNVYLNSHQAKDKSASGQTMINSNSVVADPEYSSIDQNQRETTHSNNEPLFVDRPQSEQMETYMNISKRKNPFLGENDSIINDSHPVYYELDITKNNPECEKQEIGMIGGTTDAATGTHKVYSKLGDQSRNCNNPYNSLSGTGDSVTAAHLNVPAFVEETNLSSEYSLASSIDA